MIVNTSLPFRDSRVSLRRIWKQSLTLRVHSALVHDEGEKKTTRMLNVFELCFVALGTGREV